MRMRQVGNDALYIGQKQGSLSWVQYGVGLWAKWVHQSQWVGMRVSRGVQEGLNENQYQDQIWVAKVGWVKGPQAEEMHLPQMEGPQTEKMPLEWVEEPRAKEMQAGWVQVSQDQLQPKGLLHADHGPQLRLCLGLQQHADHSSMYLGVLRLCLGLQQLLIQSHAHCLPTHLLQDHHQAQPQHLGCAGRGSVLGCLQEASPTVHYGFQSETEKEPV